MREMGCCPSRSGTVSPGPGIVDPKVGPKPSFDYIVRGNFIPQQNGDLKVCEEQGSTDSIFLDDGNIRTDIESWLREIQ